MSARQRGEEETWNMEEKMFGMNGDGVGGGAMTAAVPEV